MQFLHSHETGTPFVANSDIHAATMGHSYNSAEVTVHCGELWAWRVQQGGFVLGVRGAEPCEQRGYWGSPVAAWDH